MCFVSDKIASYYDPIKTIGKTEISVTKDVKKKFEDDLRNIHDVSGGKTGGIVNAGQLLKLLKALDAEQIRSIGAFDYEKVEALLARLAIASPAMCLYRAFVKAGIEEGIAKEKSKDVAKKFVNMFNREDATDALGVLYPDRKMKKKELYYQKVLDYCVKGNLQAVLDEYVFTLSENKENILDAIRDAFLDAAPTDIKTRESLDDGRINNRLRMHFAAGYYHTKIDDKSVNRTTNVRNAFNSPFRPFVLASTSIGQEGLDFHTYCRKIVHWNLPHNPVDLEQREGRINRYMCLAIRQNLAKWAMDNRIPVDEEDGVWQSIIKGAKKRWKADKSGLVPYWVLPENFPYYEDLKIERIVPMYPHSTDMAKYKRLKQVLLFYRLTLGQPRQEELIDMFRDAKLKPDVIKELSINLSPYDRSRK